jgi:hypothetical protein
MQCREQAPTRFVLLLLCPLCLVAGCGWTRPGRLLPVFGRAQSSDRISADELRGYLATYASLFQGTVTVAADTIRAKTSGPDVRRRTLLWKLRVCPVAYQSALLPDPLQSYVWLFALAAAQSEYLDRGAGAHFFGDDQKIASDAAGELERGIEQIGARFLSPAELERVTQQVDEFARNHPMRGEFVAETIEAFADTAVESGQFSWVMTVPLSPFKALQGVDSGAQAIRDFNQTAIRFTQIAAALPTFLRWNIELLAYELETHRSVESGLAAFESIAQSAQQFSQVASSLPSDLGDEASKLVDRVSASQGEIQHTLDTAKAALEEANGTAKSLEPVASALDRTSAQLTQAGEAWTAMVSALKGSAEDTGKGKSESRPFDIQEYERTAAQINQAAIQLRGLVSETQAASTDITRRFVDHLAWRALQLVVACFVLLFVYRRIEARLGRRSTPHLG